ncbi:MAG: hypothetical protein ACRCWF_10065 [Beijerinckiaceae bacterium]
MREHLSLYMPAVVGFVLAVILWVFLSRKLAAANRSRWRAVLLCLPLVLGALVYGLFWFGFFSSPAMAVQMHAVRLTLQHFVMPFLPWIAGVWLLISGLLLLPLLKRN